MGIITASDVRPDDRNPRPEDQHRAEALERERARATVTPDAPLRTDGGTDDTDLPQLHVADTVEDRDDSNATMLVHALPSETAAEYEINERGTTVAEVNPDYPATDDVVVVMFPQRTDVTLEPLEKYAYPRQRLRLVEPFHDRDADEEAGPA